MTDLPPDAALKIARWCWPEAHDWLCGKYLTATIGEVMIRFDIETLIDVRVAELVLISRGLAEEYGIALGWAVLMDSPSRLHKEWEVCGEDIADIAMASIDVRIRAMLFVIDRQEAKE